MLVTIQPYQKNPLWTRIIKMNYLVKKVLKTWILQHQQSIRIKTKEQKNDYLQKSVFAVMPNQMSGTSCQASFLP